VPSERLAYLLASQAQTKSCREWYSKIGVRNRLARLDPAAEQTATATLPREIEVKAIEDCTVEGRTQTNNTPDHSDCGSTCGAAAHNANPSNGKQYERGEGYRRVQSPMLCSRDQSRARKPRPLQKEQRGNGKRPKRVKNFGTRSPTRQKGRGRDRANQCEDEAIELNMAEKLLEHLQ
jgi:hypothetical protein